MRTEKEIRDTLKECISDREDYELSTEGGDIYNDGWIEALEWVLQKTKEAV